MTTIHSYTNDQNVLDFPHKDLRRARAAALSMIPTTTGAAKAWARCCRRSRASSTVSRWRVPTPNVSVVDLVALLEKSATGDEVNAAFRAAAPVAEGESRGEDAPLVVDGLPPATRTRRSSTGRVHEGDGRRFIKVLSWYDNEWPIRCAAWTSCWFMASKGI